MKNQQVIISGGGTAGHIYPALVVGQKLKNKGLQITFVGSTRKLEQSIMKHSHADFIPLKIEGLKGKGWRTIKSLFILPYSFVKSFLIILNKKPSLVIGMGGYSSGPIVLLSSLLGIPCLIMEQNVCPGLTNRLLTPFVQKAVVAFQKSLPEFKGKGVHLGNPVRAEFESLQPKPREERLTVLFFGGSQGSHFLNTCIVKSLPLLKKDQGSLYFYHQTGESDLNWVQKQYQKAGFENAEVSAYFFEIYKYFEKSDLIVCRAGATTIAEVIAAQKPSILVPFPHSTDNHQLLNANELERIKGAQVLVEKDFTPQSFSSKIRDFMKNQHKLELMAQKLRQLKIKNSADKIADLCVELMNNPKEAAH
ncbi:MAG: undecaprenyldiphospho-muramoylpentapeptide beta-N-acetylglucosaminyltransferase [Candidatus Aminicenantes bacterium]|nr:undecaprenyldiphospho-muramoylpentapeptide beta-N-acetylglucosaminyltransferase [Candidatus Aminicenantes bacterium]